MKAPFVVRVGSRDLADRLEPLLRQRGAKALVETGPGDGVVVGLRDVDGPPRWLSPLATSDPAAILGFLERWGFIPRVGKPPAGAGPR